MRPDVFLWEAGDACTKADYDRAGRTAPISGTTDYDSRPEVEDDPNAWKAGAVCCAPGAEHLHLFFPETITVPEAEKVGREFCDHCPVRVDCMIDAFNEPRCGWGIRLGMTPKQLRAARTAWAKGTPIEILARSVDATQEKAA